MSPFEADLGYQPRSVLDLTIPQQDAIPTAVTFVEHQRSLLLEAQDAMAQAQQRMNAAFDRNRRHQSFAVGDQILLDSQNLELTHIGTTGRRKLASRFLGPYTIEATQGPSRYRLTLPPGLRLFPEFHVALLKLYHHDDNPRRINRVPRVIVADGEEGLFLHSITGHRRRKGVQQYRVRWMDSTV